MKAATLSGRPSRTQEARRPHAAPQPPSRDFVRQLSRTAGNRAVVRLLQRCPRCGDPRCQAGEACQHFGGLFTPGLTTRPVAPYSEAKQSSQQGQWEAEHMMPAAAWQHSGLAHRYADLPAMSISYDMHRGGQSGAGGGVTSTGSSTTAKGWSRLLGAQLADPVQREQAFFSVAMDEYNAAVMTGALSEAVVSQILQTLDLHRGMGHLSAEQTGRIQNAVVDRWYRDQQQRQAGREREAVQGLMMLDPGTS